MMLRAPLASRSTKLIHLRAEGGGVGVSEGEGESEGP